MPVYKSDNGTWYVLTRYLDWKGERKQKCKRGFETRKEAVEWERTFQQQNAADMDMTFEAFFELYANDIKPRLKENTWLTKEHIVETKIMPYFAKRIISEITTKDVMAWQNELLAYRDENRKPYSQTYLKTVHNQLSAIFNHAVRHYDLRSNPASKAGNMGTEERKEMKFWTKDEYKKFADEMMDKPVSYYAFEVLYWCGIREGELLALTSADFDFVKGTLTINKSYQRLKGRDVITTPKTKKSNRTIKMPQFLCEEMQDYLGNINRIFEFISCNITVLPKAEATRIQINNQIRLQKMLSYIYENYAEPVTLDNIAKAADISRSEAGRCFHAYMGCSPIEALIQYRLQTAHRLLSERTQTLQQISYACGFNSVNYFSRQFKKRYGYAPGQSVDVGK